MSNVIEITLRGVDETGPLLSGLGKLKGAIGLALGGIIGIKGFGALIGNMEEASDVAAQLDSAFESTGKVIGVTREQLDDLAASMQRTTTVSSTLAKEAETVLLSFTKLRGEAFERTLNVSADLSKRFGTDLVSAARNLGLALSDPAKAVERLRRSGIFLDDELDKMATRLANTGQVSKAQSVILGELEKRFGKAAEAARGTLGGAIAGLKNAFSDLFEGTKESGSSAASAINDLAAAITDSGLKSGVDALIAGMAKVAELAVKAGAGVADALRSVDLGKLSDLDKRISETRAEVERRSRPRQLGRGAYAPGEDENEPARFLRGGAPVNLSAYKQYLETLLSMREKLVSSGDKGKGADVLDRPVAQLEEVNVTVKKIVEDNIGILRGWNDETKTSIQKQAQEYTKLKETLTYLRDRVAPERGGISGAEYQKRLGGALDEMLPEINLNEIRAMYKSFKRDNTELGEFMKGVWRGAGESIRSTISDAVYDGKVSLKSLVDIGRRVAADLIAAFATAGFKNLFKGNYTKGQGFFSAVASAFGFSAGGGKSTRPRWVGEEGPELAVPGVGGMSVYNRRQLASMGAGGSNVDYAPTYNFTMVERDDPDKTRREILEVVALQRAKDFADFQGVLQRSGVDVRV